MASREDDLIARWFAPIAGPAGLGLLDDAARLTLPEGEELVLTKDALVAGVHFFPDDPPGSIAVKALGVNLSDLAAKAAHPLGFLLAIALPPDWTAPWMDGFAEHLAAAARQHGCPLIGGDTVSTPGPLMVSITALGGVAKGTMVPRSGARPGDGLYVSGTIGDGALGLAVRDVERGGGANSWVAALDRAAALALRDRYWHPRPRLALRAALGHVHAAMDVSDGLVGDCAKMLRASGVSGCLEAARVPLSPAASEALGLDATLRERMLTGGDDYEILASVPPERAGAFEREADRCGVPVTRIGTVVAGSAPLLVLGADGQPLAFARSSYSHL